MFAVVNFTDDESVATVPQKWLKIDDQGTTCYWPPFRGSRLTYAVKNQLVPTTEWKVFSVTVLKVYDDYEKALRKTKLAEQTSELSTCSEMDNKKNRHVNAQVPPDSSGSDSSGREDSPVPLTQLRPSKRSTVPRRPMQFPPPPPPPPPPKTCSGMLLPSPKSLSHQLPDVSLGNVTYVAPQISHEAEIQTSNQTIAADITPVTTPCAVRDPPRMSQSISASSFISASDRRVLMILDEIKSQGQTQILLLQQILYNQNGRNDQNDVTEEFNLPLTTVQQLLKLESDCQDRDIKGKLTRYLSTSGGATVGDATRNIMRRIFTNGLSVQCNWKGRGGKQAFGRSAIKKMVCDAVRRNPSTARAVDTEIDKAIKDWLRFAKDRDGGRLRRAGRVANRVSTE